jgi:hypothetical protein
MSIRQYYNTNWFKTKEVAYHIGGDDHLVLGPKGLLDLVTENHIAYGSIISVDKHRLSQHAVFYTERILYFKNTKINIPYVNIVDNLAKCIFVDSIKLRLLSPSTKNADARDKNISIGKGLTLMNNLKFITNGVANDFKKAIRDRFLYRFRDWIPSSNHRTLSALCRLPRNLGGLGLIFEDEILELLDRIPSIFNWALRTVTEGGTYGLKVRMLLASINSNLERGVENKYVQDIIGQWIDYPSTVEAKTYKEVMAILLNNYPEDEDLKDKGRKLFSAFKRYGYYSYTELGEILSKPFIFTELLSAGPTKEYNTIPMNIRYSNVWKKLESFKLEFNNNLSSEKLSVTEYKSAEYFSRNELFIDVNISKTVLIGSQTRAADEMEYFQMLEETTDLSFWEFVKYGSPSFSLTDKIWKKALLDSVK